MDVIEVHHPGGGRGAGGGRGPRSSRHLTPTNTHTDTQPAILTSGRCSRAGPEAGGAMEEQQQRDEAAEERQERGAAGGGGGAAAAARLPQADAAGRLHGS